MKKISLTILLVTFLLFSNCSKSGGSDITPVANFSYTTVGNNTRAPATIKFTNASLSSSSYLWTFGDGTTSIQDDPSHKYTVAGNYTVTLTATLGSKTNVKSQAVNIQIPYTKIAITNILLNSISETSSFTAYFRFSNSANTELWRSGNVTINPSALPVNWSITTPYVFPNLSGTSYIEIWKVGTFINNQVTSSPFIPSLFNTGDIAGNSYPTSMPGINGLSFTVQWGQ